MPDVVKITEEQLLATSDADSTAIPISANFNEGASLAPSPVLTPLQTKNYMPTTNPNE